MVLLLLPRSFVLSSQTLREFVARAPKRSCQSERVVSVLSCFMLIVPGYMCLAYLAFASASSWIPRVFCSWQWWWCCCVKPAPAVAFSVAGHIWGRCRWLKLKKSWNNVFAAEDKMFGSAWNPSDSERLKDIALEETGTGTWTRGLVRWRPGHLALWWPHSADHQAM